MMKGGKRPATITIEKRNYAKSHKNGAEFISVDFWGHNEGSCGGCDSEEEANEKVQNLLKQYSTKYNIKVIDKRIKQTTL